MSIYTEKADQAAALLHEFDLDCWLTFARESVVSPDPGIELAIGSNVIAVFCGYFSESN